jgi:uncharacterized membrane protein YphA (DoxX/SURF4 family)
MPLQRWIDRWNEYWFPTTGTRNLAIVRIGMVAAQLFWFYPPLQLNLNRLAKNPDFLEPQRFIQLVSAIVPRHLLFSPSGFTALYWITAAAGVLALIGLFTRPSLLVLAFGIWTMVAVRYSFADVHHEATLFSIILLCLAFAPSGRSLSVDAWLRRRRAAVAGRQDPAAAEQSDMAMWPIKLTHVLLALTYLSTGATKLIDGGPAWMNGYTLQSYLMRDAIPREFPLGLWLAQHHTLCIAFSVFTILFETFFFLSLVFPWTAPFFFVGGIFFHLGLYFTAGHDFFPHMVQLALLTVVLAPPWLQELWRTRLGGFGGPRLAPGAV